MNRLALLAALLLAIAGAWLLLKPGEERPSEEPTEVRSGEPSAPGADVLLTGQPGSRAGSRDGDAAEGGRRPRVPPVIDPRTLSRGPLEVHVLGPDDGPVPTSEVTVDVGPVPGNPAWFDQPLLRPDPEGHVWKGDGFLAGPVRVRVWGDHVVEQGVDAVVTPEPGEPLVVRVAWAGSIEYRATLLDGTAPKDVRLTLVGARQLPAVVGYQVRTAGMLTSPRHVPEMVQGPEGVLFGIPPGRYTLRAVAPATDERDVQEVEIEPKKTLPVTLRLAR